MPHKHCRAFPGKSSEVSASLGLQAGRQCIEVRVQVYGWSTSVGAIVTELAAALRRTVGLPVRENQSIWDPRDSTDDKTLFILLTPQTVSAYPMYYVAYQTEQWGTHFLDEGSMNWGVPRGWNKTSSYRQVCIAIQHVFQALWTACYTPILSPARPRVWFPDLLQGWKGCRSVYRPLIVRPPLPCKASGALMPPLLLC